MALRHFSINRTLNISSINLNSAGSSDGSIKVLSKKLNNIMSCGSDIIFICDTRLGPGKYHHARFGKFLRYSKTPYDYYGNCPLHHRGVGILIKRGLDCKVGSILKDNTGNLLGMVEILVRNLVPSFFDFCQRKLLGGRGSDQWPLSKPKSGLLSLNQQVLSKNSLSSFTSTTTS